MTMTVWITGVTGFTGKHLVDHLNQLPDRPRIVGLGRSEHGPEGLDTYHAIDLTQNDAANQLAQDEPPEIVIHLAAATSPLSDADKWHVNVAASVNLLRGLAGSGRKGIRFVNIGSAAEYLNKADGYLSEMDPVGGESVYGRSKWAQGRLALDLGEQFAIDVIIARTFNLIGPGLPDKWVAGSLCKQFARPDSAAIKVGNTQSERDFLDVRDAVAAYWELAKQGVAGQAYNVCTGQPTKIEKLLDLFSAYSDNRHTVEVDKTRFQRVDLDRVYGDNSKILAATNWKPAISLEQSLQDMFAEAQA